MDSQTALRTLVQLTEAAQRRGAYSLEEAATAWEAVQCFMSPPPQTVDQVPDNPALGDDDDSV